MAVDTNNDKLLVIPDGVVDYQTSLIRCNPDGSDCTFTDLVPTNDAGADLSLSETALIDSTHRKLLVIESGAWNLLRCELDGTECTYEPVLFSGSVVVGSSSAALDATHGKLLIVLASAGNGADVLSLLRCDLDGTGCQGSQMFAGDVQTTSTAWSHRVLVDPINDKILVVTTGDALLLFRCDLDGQNCTHTQISSITTLPVGTLPAALVDTINRKLLVVIGDGVGLVRCELDGSNCTVTDLSASGEPGGGIYPLPVIDETHQKLLVVDQDALGLGLTRCNLDGTGCTYHKLSNGFDGLMVGPVEVFSTIDRANNRLLVTSRVDPSSNVALFDVCLW